MRVSCFLFPHFVVQVEVRDKDSLKRRSIIIGGLPYERKVVYDASQETLSCSVRQGMPLREAYALCLQGVFLPLDEGKYATVFTAVLTSLANCSPVVEARTPGSAFIDLSYECHELQFVEGARRIIEKRFQLHSFTSIAPNKFVASAASRVARPGKVTVIQ